MPQAVAWGLPPTLFWQLTPREINDILKASAAKERRNYAQQAALLYNGALLLGSVIHNPRKISLLRTGLSRLATRTTTSGLAQRQSPYRSLPGVATG